MRRKLLFWVLFFGSVCFFCVQTVQALGVVSFHAELFEKKGTIVIDAGHGGEDGGTVGINGEMEKDINLNIALALAQILKQNNFEVILTRDADCSIGDQTLSTIAERKRSDTKKRLQIVQETGECILISIHQNHFTESQYHGAQMFYSGNREESALLAESIRQSVTQSLQPENKRENKQAESSIYLLYHAQVPAVLVECGFLSNPEEAELLTQEEYQKSMAAAIYNGLVNYLKDSVKNSENAD